MMQDSVRVADFRGEIHTLTADTTEADLRALAVPAERTGIRPVEVAEEYIAKGLRDTLYGLSEDGTLRDVVDGVEYLGLTCVSHRFANDYADI